MIDKTETFAQSSVLLYGYESEGSHIISPAWQPRAFEGD